MPDWTENGRGQTSPATNQWPAVADVDYGIAANRPADNHGGNVGPPRAAAANATGVAWVWLLDQDPATDPSVKRSFVAGAEYATAIRQIDGSQDYTAELVLLP